MKCIFCFNPSDSSKSVEHIIPESLGNAEHVLPVGVVCDKCNQYFAVKIENPLLDQDYFKYIRFIQDIYSKKGKDVPGTGIILHPRGGKVDVHRYPGSVIGIDTENDEVAQLIGTTGFNRLYIPIRFPETAQNSELSRLLAKAAVEAFFARLMNKPDLIEGYFSDDPLHHLRNYARYGPQRIKHWAYHQRFLYTPGQLFKDQKRGAEHFEILHEFCFHLCASNVILFVLAILGVEYVINLENPEETIYEQELEARNGKSPLYSPDEIRMPF